MRRLHIYITGRIGTLGFLLLSLLSSAALWAAGDKKPLDEKAYSDWYYLSKEAISSDGKWISYEQRNLDSARFLMLYGNNRTDTIVNGRGGAFSPCSRYFLYRIETKKSQPGSACFIKTLGENKTTGFRNAAQVTFLPAKKTVVQILRPHKKAGTDITLFFPETNDSVRLEGVAQYKYAPDYGNILYAKAGDTCGCWRWHDIAAGTGREVPLPAGVKISMSCFSGDLSEMAILYKAGTEYKIDIFSLPSFKKKASLDDLTGKLPQGYHITGGKLEFSACGSYLYFKAGRKPLKTADTVRTGKKVMYDLWKWNADFIPPAGKRGNREPGSDFCSCHIKSGKVLALTTAEIPFLQFPSGEKEDMTIAFSNLPYLHLDGIEPGDLYDTYLVNMRTGRQTKVLEKRYYYPSISSDKKYIVWFEPEEKGWLGMDTQTLEKVNLTGGIDDIFYNDELDMPMHATHWGSPGWSEKGHFVYLNSKYDIWKIDASGKEAPVCITAGKGKREKIVFRFIKTSESQRYYREDELTHFTAFSPETKKAGYYLRRMNGEFTPLLFTDHSYSGITFSPGKKFCLFRKQSFTEYPDIYRADAGFNRVVKVSDAARQQKAYNWGTSELTEWTDFNGKRVRGILCKPENFDPSRKYPMLVYFYEKKSDELHKYRIPAPVGTVINWVYCASNGYLVFIPDIEFTPGEPGESSYNAVVSGVKYLADTCPFVDKENIGLNGHSWGGYQVAYLLTRTGMFKAAVSGAPVVNMISGYGGIRWSTGKSRMFQYEHSQSRIGGTLWEKPENYLRNSPIFRVPEISTPVLIMHNDHDGSVMWEQGIEFFMALRRLQKPAWLINYKGADHKLTDWRQRLDYSRKVMEFYDYYLRGGATPAWMH